jgi:hypothetical protein
MPTPPTDPAPTPPPASVRRALRRTYSVWVLFQRAADVAGLWTAQCLDVGVVTHGRSLEDAIRMAREAITMVIEDELAGGHDPLDRPAPEEDWAALWQVVHASRPADWDHVLPEADAVERCAALLVVRIVEPRTPDDAIELPALWTTRRAA